MNAGHEKSGTTAAMKAIPIRDAIVRLHSRDQVALARMDLPGGARIHPFGEGGGRRTAERYEVPLLAEVPLDGAIREGGDQGRPVVLNDRGPGLAFRDLAATVREALS